MSYVWLPWTCSAATQRQRTLTRTTRAEICLQAWIHIFPWKRNRFFLWLTWNAYDPEKHFSTGGPRPTLKGIWTFILQDTQRNTITPIILAWQKVGWCFCGINTNTTTTISLLIYIWKSSLKCQSSFVDTGDGALNVVLAVSRWNYIFHLERYANSELKSETLFMSLSGTGNKFLWTVASRHWSRRIRSLPKSRWSW